MTTNPASRPSDFSIEDALSRFDLLIDNLAADSADSAEADVAETDVAEGTEMPDSVVTGDSEVAIDAAAIEAEAVDTVVAPPAAAVKKLKRATKAKATATAVRESPESGPIVLQISGLSKSFGETVAVDNIDLTVRAGQVFGIVGPNGAGKTTTLSMVTGVLRPDAGVIHVHGSDVWANPAAAKRNMGILPDRLMLFDRLTGRQLLYYSGVLRGLSRAEVASRSTDLIAAFGLQDAQDRLVTDYSAGMTRKIALAAAMIHSPRLLILDEPFESVDAVSVDTIIGILHRYALAGGTVVLSSHSMELVERFCDSVAVVAEGRILTSGTTEEVRGDTSLEERFIDLIGGVQPGEDMEWLRSFSD